MSGRSMAQVDLRIYKINPLNRNFWPFPNSPVVVDDNRLPKGPGEEPAYTTAMREQVKLLDSPLVSKVVPLPLKKGTGKKFGIDLKPHLSKISGKGGTGTYLVGYRTIGTGSQRHYVRIQVTDLCLSTVEEDKSVAFVVTSLKTGLPVQGAKVQVQYTYKNKIETLISGITGTDGIYRYHHKSKLPHGITRIVVNHKDDILVLDPRNAPPHFMNNHWYNSYRSWLGWLTNYPSKLKTKETYKAHILTERPVYRARRRGSYKGLRQDTAKGKNKSSRIPR